MASGDRLCDWTALAFEIPTSNGGQHDVRNNRPCVDLDAANDESLHVSGLMPPHYSGGTFVVNVTHASSTATSGNVVLTAEMERVGTVLDMDGDSFAAASTVTTAVSGTSGNGSTSTIAAVANDSVAAGEFFRLRITRDANNASDTAAGDLEVFAVELKET